MKYSRREFLKALAAAASISTLGPILASCKGDLSEVAQVETASPSPLPTVNTSIPTPTLEKSQIPSQTNALSPGPTPSPAATLRACVAPVPVYIKADEAGSIILRDEFSGNGSLSDHFPDVHPPNSSWNLVMGSWTNLEGGWVKAGSGDLSLALIDCQAADVEMSALMDLEGRRSGLCGRSNPDGSNRLMTWIDVDAKTINLAAFSSGYGQGNLLASYPLDPALFSTSPAACTLRWGMYGKDHRLYLNDELVLVAESTLYQTNTFHGLGGRLGGGKWGRIEIRKTAYKRISAFGDSITAGVDTLLQPKWIYLAMHVWNHGRTSVFNHAAGGKKVMYDLQWQVQDAAEDDADIILIEMGTNDHVLLPGFEGVYVDALDHVKASNQRARIICMGILERAFDNAGRDGINAAIAGAAATSYCEYWDTTGWIDPAAGIDTVDGLHPNACGNQKIAERVIQNLSIDRRAR